MKSLVDTHGKSQRIRYFDTLRLMAMVIIYVTHFIERFSPDSFYLWKTMPTSIILYDITGKFGVVLFGVILGYFAYLNKDNNSTRYVVKRYAFFAFGGLLINALYAVVGLLNANFAEYSIKTVLLESLLLNDTIYATYWCIPYFFLGSIISYVNKKADVSPIFIVFEIFIFYLLGLSWIGVCLVGNLLAIFMSKKLKVGILKYRIVRIMALVLLFFAIKLPNFLLDAVWCSLLIIVIDSGTVTKRILNNRLTSYMGEQGMGVYLLHPLCYNLLGPVIFEWLSSLPYSLSFCICLVVCFIVVIILSIPIVWLVNFVVKNIGVFTEKCQTVFFKHINTGDV